MNRKIEKKRAKRIYFQLKNNKPKKRLLTDPLPKDKSMLYYKSAVDDGRKKGSKNFHLTEGKRHDRMRFLADAGEQK